MYVCIYVSMCVYLCGGQYNYDCKLVNIINIRTAGLPTSSLPIMLAPYTTQHTSQQQERPLSGGPKNIKKRIFFITKPKCLNISSLTSVI